jgi:uncharacterized protein (DUF305 family)
MKQLIPNNITVSEQLIKHHELSVALHKFCYNKNTNGTIKNMLNDIEESCGIECGIINNRLTKFILKDEAKYLVFLLRYKFTENT